MEIYESASQLKHTAAAAGSAFIFVFCLKIRKYRKVIGVSQ
jgi:hypothetical protein